MKTEMEHIDGALVGTPIHQPRLLAALKRMTAAFRPFTMKPIGAPFSPARLDQDEQKAAHMDAVRAIAAAERVAPDGQPAPIDHRALLMKYIAHVDNYEGTNFLPGPDNERFSEAEAAELARLEEEGWKL